MAYRKHTFGVWKNGKVVEAKLRGAPAYMKSLVHEPLDRKRVFAVDTESLKCGEGDEARLRTLLIPVHFCDRTLVLETPDGRGSLEKLFDEVFAQPGYATPDVNRTEHDQRKSRYVSRPGSSWKLKQRPGRRDTVEPVLSVWFNMPSISGGF